MFKKILILAARKANQLATLAAALILTATQSQASQCQPTVTSPPMETVRVYPLTLERGFEVFRTICLNSFPDPAAFDRAASVSDLGFERAPASRPGEHKWASRHGTLIFNSQWPMDDGRPMIECDFRFAIANELSSRELISRIEAALAPGRPRADVAGVAIWDLGNNFADRLNYFPASPDIRFFSLNRRRIFGNRQP